MRLLMPKVKRRCYGRYHEKIDFYLKKRAAGRLQIECIVYSNTYGLLGMTAKAEELLRRLL